MKRGKTQNMGQKVPDKEEGVTMRFPDSVVKPKFILLTLKKNRKQI